MIVKTFRTILVGVLLGIVFPGLSFARFDINGDPDYACVELPTAGDPLGSTCKCFTTTFREFVWSGISICVGKKAGEDCDKPAITGYDFNIQDSVMVNPVSEGGIIYSASDFWAAYNFHHKYDSTHVIYRFMELTQGSNRIELANWDHEGYETGMTPSELSAISKSKPFVVTGQQIRYCHVVEWFDPRSGYRTQEVDNFYCKDTLTYVIKAVNETTQQSVTIETLTFWSDGSHIIITGGNPIAVVQWTPPSTWNGQSAHIKIDLSQSGSGAYNPARHDLVSGRGSTALTESYYSAYFEDFNESYSGGGIQ